MLIGRGIISDFQKRILNSLKNLLDFSYFYLTGGMALAEFYFAHRRFYDLDIFTVEERLVLPFAYDLPFRFEEPVDSDLGIKINDYKDIVLDKLLTFFGRVEPRDAIDLLFILKKENIWKLAKVAVQKGPGFDLYWLLAVALEKVKDFPDDITR